MVSETVFLSWRWAEGAENLPRLQARRCGHLSRLVTARALLYPNSDAAVFPFQTHRFWRRPARRRRQAMATVVQLTRLCRKQFWKGNTAASLFGYKSARAVTNRDR